MLQPLDFKEETLVFTIEKGEEIEHNNCVIQRLGEIEEEEPNVVKCYVIVRNPPKFAPGKGFKWSTFSYAGKKWQVVEERNYSLFNTRVRLKATRYDDMPSLYKR